MKTVEELHVAALSTAERGALRANAQEAATPRTPCTRKEEEREECEEEDDDEVEGREEEGTEEEAEEITDRMKKLRAFLERGREGLRGETKRERGREGREEVRDN